MASRITRAFLERYEASSCDGAGGELDRQLTLALERGRTAFGTVGLDDAAFGRHLATKIRPGLSEELACAELAALNVAELYLACACALGDARALAIFDETILSNVPRFIGSISREPDFVATVQQELRAKLFLPADAPAIREYQGRGPLGGWVRVTAVRTALNLRRSESRAAERGAQAALPESTTGDPELDFLKAKYAREVRQALEITVAALPPETRTLLRMHYLDGLGIDQLAALYDIHRSTAARRIADARAAILSATKRRLLEALKLTTTEMNSVVALVQSQLDMSWRVLLPDE